MLWVPTGDAVVFNQCTTHSSQTCYEIWYLHTFTDFSLRLFLRFDFVSDEKGTRRQRAQPTSCNRCPFRPISNGFDFAAYEDSPCNGLFNSIALTPLWQFSNISLSADVTILGRRGQFKCEEANNVRCPPPHLIDWPTQILREIRRVPSCRRTDSIQLLFQFQSYGCFVRLHACSRLNLVINWVCEICICAHITANLLLLVSHPLRNLIVRNRKITHVFGYIFVLKTMNFNNSFASARMSHDIWCLVFDVRALCALYTRSQSAEMAKWQMAHC